MNTKMAIANGLADTLSRIRLNFQQQSNAFHVTKLLREVYFNVMPLGWNTQVDHFYLQDNSSKAKNVLQSWRNNFYMFYLKEKYSREKNNIRPYNN
jgi:hypothetical protein